MSSLCLVNPYWFSAGDPFFSSVQLLLHLDGTNGSTTFTDSSSSPKTVSRTGDVTVSTAQSKWGGASGVFDGLGDRLQATSAAFTPGTGDFTVECWIRSNTIGAGYFAIYLPTGSLGLYRNTDKIIWYDGADRCTSAAISATTWTHVAYSRNSGTGRIFVGGVVSGTTYADSTNLNNTTHTIGLNPNAGVEGWDGYIDDVRLTVGVGRYTSNFTPPTAAFPNF